MALPGGDGGRVDPEGVADAAREGGGGGGLGASVSAPTWDVMKDEQSQMRTDDSND